LILRPILQLNDDINPVDHHPKSALITNPVPDENTLPSVLVPVPPVSQISSGIDTLLVQLILSFHPESLQERKVPSLVHPPYLHHL
jgi:hypothetical protein